MGAVTTSLSADLRRVTGAWASSAARTLGGASSDFGGIIRKRPAVVARPTSAKQIASVLKFASAQSIPVSVRASGHSAGGQTLNDGGIVLDMRRMSRVLSIDAAAGWVEVQPGARWGAVVEAVLKRGLVPPVLTGTLSTSVGGTHSVAGLGFASFRHGVQLDHCLGVEVATVDGELTWCDANVDSELFEHVLGGLGQLAVMTRVLHRLRPFRAETRQWRLYYATRARMLADLATLATDGRADFLAGFGKSAGDRFAYFISVTFEGDTSHGDDRERILTSLAPSVMRGPVIRPFERFTLRDASSVDRHRWRPRLGWANPWIDAIMPQERVDPYFNDILPRLPAPVRRNVTLAFLPVCRRCLSRPLFIVPQAEHLMLAGIWFPTIPASEARAATQAMALAAERVTVFGGKRCLYTLMQLDAAGWANYYGERWPTLRRLKAGYDPQGILNPGFITYDF